MTPGYYSQQKQAVDSGAVEDFLRHFLSKVEGGWRCSEENLMHLIIVFKLFYIYEVALSLQLSLYI